MSKLMLAIAALQLTGGGITAAQVVSAPMATEAGEAAEIGGVEMDMAPGHEVEHPMQAPRTRSERRLIVPSGTGIPVTIDENVAIQKDQIGNTFAAHVTRNVVIDGAIAIPSGAPAELVLTENRENGSASFRLVRISIDGAMRPVRTEVGRADAVDHGLSTGKKTGIGAAVGGVLGLITGGGGGLLKGAAIGAGGGLAWGLLDHGSKRVEQGSAMEFTLVDPVRVR